MWLYISFRGVNSAVERFSSPEFILSRNYLQKSAQKVFFKWPESRRDFFYIYFRGVISAVEQFLSPEFILSRNFLTRHDR